MGKKIPYETEKQVLQLYNENLNSREIAEQLRISRRSVFNILKTYRVPLSEKRVEEKKDTINILKLLSLRLWYFCEDYELLCKMLVVEVCMRGCEKIIVPKKMTSIINKEKIQKVVSIVNKAGLECELSFAVA